MSATEKVRFGILGCGRIAVKAFVPAIAASDKAVLVAAASRDCARAAALGVRAYGSYDELLDDEEVEAVYIATHNGLHLPLAVAAMSRGKHVLCEKPLASNAAECREMIAAARRYDRLLVEAFMYRHHPRMLKLKELVDGGAIGALRTVEASFSFTMRAPDDVRYKPEWGGGALLDVGCYCVNFCRYIFGARPLAVTAIAGFHPQHQVDWALHGVLDYGDGRAGVISCGFDGGFRRRGFVCGTEGTIDVPRTFGNDNQPLELLLDAAGRQETIEFPPAHLFRLEIEDLARAIRTGTPPLLPLTDGLENAIVMDALLASAKAGGTRVECASAEWCMRNDER